MKNLFLILVATLFIGCNNLEKNKKTDSINTDYLMPVSFELGPSNKREKIIVAYTNDSDSLWLKYKWVTAIKIKMMNLSSNYSTILLFNKKENMPNVALKGMNYSSKYDKYMVCGYWVYPNGNKKFCYGGIKSDGNFKKCE